LVTVGGAGDPHIKTGLAIYLYAANTSMKNTSFFNSDGDFLIGNYQILMNEKTKSTLGGNLIYYNRMW
jgi:homogentisate 1,2-dioxygenase